jgi:hypothetical protein
MPVAIHPHPLCHAEQHRELRRSVARGAFLFDYLLLGKQEKVIRLAAETAGVKD